MTMVNIFQYGLLRSSPSSASEIRRCAVELTGRNSVTPSMIPSTMDKSTSLTSTNSNHKTQNDLAQDIGIHAGHQIIRQNSPTGRQLFQFSARPGLDHVENPKPCTRRRECNPRMPTQVHRQPQHRH